MTVAIGSLSYLAFIKEVTAGTTPSTPTMKKIRSTGGTITNERSVLQSGEIRSDRGISDVRLGTNQPAVSIPVEFSFAEYDQLLEGAFGKRWLGGYTLSVAVDFLTSPASSIDHATGASWLDLGLNVGDYIVISNTDETANAGLYKISAIGAGAATYDRLTVTLADGSTAKTFTADTDDAVTIKSGYKGGSFSTATTGITVSSTGKTYTAASALWLTTFGLIVGDKIYFSGFAQSGNNGWKTVVTVTDTVLTVSETCTAETISTGTVYMGSAVGYLATDTDGDIPSFTIEEGFTDIDQYHNITGAKVDKFSVSCQPDKMVEASFDLIGMTYSGFAGSSIATSLTEPGTESPFDSFTGELSINTGAVTHSTGIVTGINLQISNGLSRRYGLFSKNASGVGEARVNCSGSINAFMSTGVPLSILYSAETTLDLSFALIDLSGNRYTFRVPKLKFTKDSRSRAEGDITESLDFQALISSSVTMQITKSAA